MNSLNQKINLLAIFLTFFFSFQNDNVFAQTHSEKLDPVASEVAVLVPWSFIDQWINSRLGSQVISLEEPIGPLQMNSKELPVLIRQAQLNAQIQFGSITTEGPLSYWHTRQLALTIHLGAFQVNQRFQREVAGATVIVDLKAECDPISISLPQADLTALIGLESNGQDLSVLTKDLQLNWPLNSWKIGPINCQGPQGFGTLVSQQIHQFLSNESQLNSWVTPKVQEKLNSKMKSIYEPLKQASWLGSDKLLSQQLKSTRINLQKGLVFKSLLQSPSPNLDVNRNKFTSLHLDESHWEIAPGQPLLVIPKEFIENTAKNSSAYPSVKTDLRKISSFQKLMKSRFLQFFVWPELLKFKKNARFEADTRVQAGSADLKFGVDQKAFAKVTLQTWLFAERRQLMESFGYLETSIQSSMNYFIQNGELIFKFEKPKTLTKSSYSEDYVRKYKPAGKPPVSQLKSAVKNFFKSSAFNVKLPIFKFSLQQESTELKATAVKDFKQNLVFILK
jgi:hypothetical protein